MEKVGGGGYRMLSIDHHSLEQQVQQGMCSLQAIHNCVNKAGVTHRLSAASQVDACLCLLHVAKACVQ